MIKLDENLKQIQCLSRNFYVAKKKARIIGTSRSVSENSGRKERKQ